MRLYTIFDDMYFHFYHQKAVQARVAAALETEVSTPAFWTSGAGFNQRGPVE